jgi:hypothetical protein
VSLSGVEVSRSRRLRYSCRSQIRAFSSPQARRPHSNAELMSVSASS